MLSHYKTILFDIDDTLLDFKKAQKFAFAALLDALKIPNKPEYFTAYDVINLEYWEKYEQNLISREEVLNARFTNFFKTIGHDVDGHKCDVMYRKFLEIGNQLYTDTIAVLDKYKDTHTLAIVTNGEEVTQLARLNNNNLMHYFNERIFCSDTVGYQKPEKEFFDTVFTQLPTIDKQSTIIVGDSFTADVTGGYNYGIATCWINPHQKPTQNGITPTYTIQSISELLNNA